MDNCIFPNIIVIGGNHHNTLGVIRALGQKGLKQYIILLLEGCNNSFVARSKYILPENKFYFSSCDEIPQLIKSISFNVKIKPIVIACGDNYIASIDRNYNELKEYCILPNANATQGRINLFLDKANQDEIAIQCDIKVPQFRILKVSQLSDVDFFPCIIKPFNSIEGAKKDICVCHSPVDIYNYVRNHSLNSIVRVEKFINKVLEFQLIGCSLSHDIIIPGYTQIIRQPQNTNTGYLKYCPLDDGTIDPQLIDKVHKFIREIGYCGLFSVEFIRDSSNVDYFLEINMRNDGNAFCVTTAGVNLPYIWYKYCDKEIYRIEETTRFCKPIYWMPEADIRNAKIIGIFKWIKEWLSADSHGIANIKDPYPLISKFMSIKRPKIMF